ncbi:DUF4240 domain-containing protein [Amycolatopsis sp. NPDC102389]|uniref:DUF4240 domain-containing protein n=1 Tax=Amycolatopsis sp. NPDC102389 TaxID=3363941 RepID=UPI0037F38375
MPDFWSVIGVSSVRDAGDVEAALERISSRLNAMTIDALVRFAELLQGALFQIDRRELAEIPVYFSGLEFEQTSDHFQYARCACILAGEKVYGEVLKNGSGFELFVAPDVQGAEGLLYLASEMYERKAGEPLNSQSFLPVDSMSNVQGWSD